jgi:hypothetical protein
MAKPKRVGLAGLGAIILATGAAVAPPASAASPGPEFLIRPCYQTGPQISESVETVWDVKLYFVQGTCFTPGAPVSLLYRGFYSDGAPFWYTRQYTTAQSNGDITVNLLGPPTTVSGSELVQAFNDENSAQGSNILSVTLPV